MMYRITATVIHHTTDRHCLSVDAVKQIPTFLLDGDYLGIVDESHAEQIAREVICPVDLQYESVTVTTMAVKV